ncbi:MAG TPA: helix-turn-helix domain-containing protein [Actinoplanes sp.]|nr:helix-turn-helix domain-containing protein [Actinoplanes sp.]
MFGHHCRTGRAAGILDPDLIHSRDDLGRALTALRHRAGLTIRDLARRADLPKATADDYLRARHLPGPAQGEQFQALLIACGVTEEDELARWQDALLRVRAGSDGRSRRRRAGETPPYRGLKPFEPEDAGLFFGRDAFVARTIERLADRPPLMFLIGASGSGKSSVLRAGLVPAIEAGGGTASIMVPGRDPVAALERAIAAAPGVLIVDQFEELYTLADEPAATDFVRRLAGLGPATTVVAGLRADFFSRVASDPALVPALQTAQVVVPPLSEAELRAAVVEPAAARGVTVDEALVDLVLTEVERGAAGALPLLSHALLSAWENGQGDRVTVADYKAAGGLRGAVQQSAEIAYAELDESQRELARRMFLRLVAVDDDVITTKRRIDRSELPADSAAALEGFVTGRLITVDEKHVEISHDALLTAWPRLAEWVAADHAGLLTHRRLTRAANEWQVNGNDSQLLLRGTVLAGAEEWAADPDHDAAMNRLERAFLVAGVSAREAEQRSARRRVRLLVRLVGALVVALLVTVFSAVHAVRSGDEAARQQRAAERARDEALSRQVAIESTRAAATDPALSQQLALAAYRISPTVDARSALLDATSAGVVDRRLGASGPTAMRLNPAGTVVAVSDALTGEVVLRGFAANRIGDRLGAVPAEAKTDQVYALAWAPDGRALAIGGVAGRVRIFDVADPAHPVALPSPPGGGGAVEGLAFAPDGSRLVAVGADPPTRSWARSGDGWRATPLAGRSAGGPEAGAGGDDVDQAVAFSPDGRTLAVGGSSGSLRRWRDGKLTTVPITDSTITVVAFAPDGSSVLVGAKDHSVTIVGATRRRLETGFTTWVNAAAYAPDGRLVAVGGSNGTIAVFDAAGARVDTIAGSAQVTSLAYTRDGSMLLAAAADGTVRGFPARPRAVPGLGGPLFSVGFARDGSRLVAASTGDTGRVSTWSATTSAASTVALPAWLGPPDGTSAISPDGRLIAAGSATGRVVVVGEGRPPVRLTGATAVIEQLAFGPRGDLVAAGSDDGFVHLWDVGGKAFPPLNAGGLTASVAFSPDGKLLAGASVDRSVHLWDVRDPAHARPVATPGGFDNYAWSVAFSPDSATLAAGGADDTIRRWDVRDPAHPRSLGPPLTGPTHYIAGLAFSPDGRTLAASGGDGSVWAWRDGQPTMALHAANPGGQTYTVAYSPDGRTLAAGGSSGKVVFWDTDPAVAAAAICRSGGDPLSRPEWAVYVPGAPYQETCA